MNCIITGTSRGIGLELTRQILAKGSRVLAVVRKPSSELNRLESQMKGESSAKLEILSVDIAHSEAAPSIAAAVAAWPCVDLLLNNAGIYRGDEKADDFLDSFRVNSVAPYFISRALFPFLKKSKDPKAIFITSLMGSIEDNTSGGSYSYRASKAALNMIVKGISVENTWLTASVIHPGWVMTDMGGKEAPVSVEESVRGILKVIGSLNRDQSGSFFDYEGERLPW